MNYHKPDDIYKTSNPIPLQNSAIFSNLCFKLEDMETVRTLNKWANHHLVVPMFVLRLLLGGFLFVKGIQFESQTELLLDLIRPLGIKDWGLVIVHYVAMVHFAGGLMVIFGLVTRLALFFQLPIFIGAVVVNLMNNVDGWLMAQAVFGLVATIAFIFYGSGRVSMDHNLKMHW